MTRLLINVLRVCCAGSLAIPFFDTKLHAADKAGRPIKQAEDGSITMGAVDAKIQGPNARLEDGEVKNIKWWTSADTVLQWTASVQKPGHYRVEMTYAIIGNNNGSPLIIMIGDQTVNAIPKAGGGFDDFKTAKAGEVTISQPGDLRVVIRPLFKLREYVIDLRSIVLLPADTPTEAINISGDAIEQAADGSFKLAADDAQINGTNAALVGEGNEDKQVGFWKDVGTSLVWTINVQKPGKYRVELKYSQMNSDEGAKVAIVVGDQSVKARPTAGKDWLDIRVGNAGEVTIDKPGNLQVAAFPVSKPGAFMINLVSIGLLPVETPTQAIDIRDEPIKQSADGSIKLAATAAEIDGETIRLEGGEEKYLAWRSRADSLIKWPIKIDKPGTFRIEVTYSLARSTSTDQVQFGDEEQKISATLPTAPSDRSKVSATVAGQTFVATFRAGSGWDDFKTEKLGSVTVSQGGNFEVVFSSPEPLGTLVMHLRCVSLIPLAEE